MAGPGLHTISALWGYQQPIRITQLMWQGSGFSKGGGLMAVGDGAGGGQFQTTGCPTTPQLLGLQLSCHPSETLPVFLTFPSLPQLVG